METIGPENLLLEVVPILDGLGIDYYVTGGFAVSVWGRPRSTVDLDVVVKIVEPKVVPLAQALRGISEFGYIDEDTARAAIAQEGEFNFIDSNSGYKVDFWIMKKSSAEREYRRRVGKVVGGRRIYFISPEDLILNKLQWYRQSESSLQLDDVKSILKISGKKLDKKYLKLWARRLMVLDTLKRLNNF